MGHTSFGYRIESGKAVIDEKEVEQIRQVYHFYLAGDGLMTAAGKAGITSFHGGVSRMLRNKHYLGDEYYLRLLTKEPLTEQKQSGKGGQNSLAGYEAHRSRKKLLFQTPFI
mgnify:CR=1 FL=1